MKQQLTYLLCAMILLFASCAKDDVSFTYSPTTPRAGQSITFSNHTSEGEEWSWNFGDGTSSTSKSPIKTYKKPGEYTVILKVDDKASRTYSQTITVIDTIPAVGCSDTVIYYYEPVTLTAQCYNPYGYDLSYLWDLKGGAILLEGDSSTKSITICFSRTECSVPVHCQITQGATVWEIDTTFYVNDKQATSLVMAEAGKVLHQRIYKHGFEEAIPYSIPSSFITVPSELILKNNYLYILNSDQTDNGAIVRYDFETTGADYLIKNAAAGTGQGFEHGYVNGNYIYWTAADNIYKASSATLNQSFDASAGNMLLTSAANIGYSLSAGLTSGGLSICNGICHYAYGQGLHRFAISEIGGTPAEGSILTDQTITAFALDAIAQKVYFATSQGLFICNFIGANIVLIDANANGKSIAVDNADNLLFWTTNDGIYYMPLIQTPNNVSSQEPQKLNDRANVTALTIDNNKR